METCVYKPANTTEPIQDHVKLTRRYFFRQLFVCCGTLSIFFTCGLYYGAPTVIIPQLRKEANSTAAVSEEMASWLSSVHGYSSVPWFFIMPILSELFGRKKPFIFGCFVIILGYLVFCFSATSYHILISEMILGVTVCCAMVIGIIVVSEYASPQYRGLFLTLKSATFFWGIWVANALGTFFYWKNIGMLALACCAFAMSSFYWPESPQFLATKGRFDECATSHRWLKGTGEEAENELNKLIISQKKYLSSNPPQDTTICNRLLKNVKILSCKSFYKPVGISMVALLMYQFSGKIVCIVYAVEIMKQITDNESTAYVGMLILDGVSVFIMYFGCFLAKIFNRRTLLFTGTSIAVSMLCTMSLYLYLVKLTYVVQNNIIPILLLMIYTIGVGCGPMILLSSIYAELIPLRYKNTALFITNVTNCILASTVLKLTPVIFKSIGIHGVFLLFGGLDTFLMLILVKYLPETKDKTLQEIEEYFQG